MPIFWIGTPYTRQLLYGHCCRRWARKSVQPTSVSLALVCFRISLLRFFFLSFFAFAFHFVAIEKHSFFFCLYSIFSIFLLFSIFKQTTRIHSIQAFCHSFTCYKHESEKWAYLCETKCNFIIVFTESRKTN